VAQNDPHSASLVRGYFWSIVFMMSMPFLLLGSLSSYFYLLIRKARADKATDDRLPPSMKNLPVPQSY